MRLLPQASPTHDFFMVAQWGGLPVYISPSSLLHSPSAKTQLGVWLIEDLHGVSLEVSSLTHTALTFLSVYPLIDAVVGIIYGINHSSILLCMKG